MYMCPNALSLKWTSDAPGRENKIEILPPQRKVRNQPLGVSLSSAVSLYMRASCCPRDLRIQDSRKVSEEFMSGQQGEEVWAMMA
jgi:hypothetical protein